MKKILFIITKSNWGGAQRYVYDLAISLPKEAFSVSVAFGGNGILQTRLEQAGIETVSIPRLGRDVHFWDDAVALFQLIRFFYRERPDIVHLNSSKAGLLGVLAARLIGVQKIIFTIHGWAFNEPRSFVSKRILILLYWMILRFSHHNIAVSLGTASQAPYKKNISVIHNGILKPSFRPKDASRVQLCGKSDELKKIVSEDPETLWIGTIAELHPIKGLLYALESVRNLAQSRQKIIWVLIGDGEERVLLEERTKPMDNVFFLGYVEEAASYLKAFDLFLVPSLSEALAYVVLEAGYARLPTVATNVGGIPEVVTDMESGILVRPKDSGEITRALNYLLNHKTRRAAMGKALYENVTINFTLEKMVRETIALYKT